MAVLPSDTLQVNETRSSRTYWPEDAPGPGMRMHVSVLLSHMLYK